MNCLVNDQHRNLGDVDQVDENLGSYRLAIPGKKWYFPLICYLISVCVNTDWLNSHESGYNNVMLRFTGDIRNYWRNTYGTPGANKGPQEAACLSRTLDAAMVTNIMRLDKVNHFIIESEGHKRKR